MHILDPASYTFSLYSLPTLATAAAVVVLGMVVLVRERISLVSVSFASLTVAVGIWLFSFSAVYSSASAPTALFWTRAAYLGVPFIAAGTYQFALTVLGNYRKYLVPALASWIGAVILAWLCASTNLILDGTYLYWWGYYARYGWLGFIFICYFAVVLVLGMGHFYTGYTKGSLSTEHRRRVKALMIAFAVGYLGVVDFLPVYGVPVYPLGYIPIAGFVVLAARAIWVHRLVDITPAYAARQIIQTMNDALLVFDSDGIVRLTNAAAGTLFGYTRDELVGKQAAAAFNDAFFATQLAKLVRSGAVSNYELNYTPPEGGARALSMSISVMHDARGNANATVCIVRDITERKTFEARLEHQAFHDPLTNLPNRVLFFERLTHSMERHQRKNALGRSRVAVLFLDVDEFKAINDSLGHRAGDQLLNAISKRLQECVRPGDTVARLGGDEFTVLLEDVEDQEDAAQIAERIEEALKIPVYLGEYSARGAAALGTHEVFVTASMGIAMQGTSADTPDDLLRRADMAMYEAKRRGKAQYVFFEPRIDSLPYQRLQREVELRQAIERRELAVFYQPLIRLSTGTVSGFEALVRWKHPHRGLVPPADFIPLAEQTGLIVPIGRWVLEEACNQMLTWHSQHPGKRSMTVSVNLSARQLQHNRLVDEIREVLFYTRLEPRYLKLEITESIGLEDVIATNSILWKIKDQGVQLALDDFGTGYSALSYLKRYPIDTLKLDRSFVAGLGQNQEDTAIVHAVVAFSNALHLSVTAEGIETAEQALALQALGCHDGQGYYFGKPMAAPSVSAMLADGKLDNIKIQETTRSSGFLNASLLGSAKG